MAWECKHGWGPNDGQAGIDMWASTINELLLSCYWQLPINMAIVSKTEKSEREKRGEENEYLFIILV